MRAPERQTQQNPTAIGVTWAGEHAAASTPRRDLQEPETGIEPVTSILPRLRSTTELLGREGGTRACSRSPEVGSGGFEPPKAEPTDLQSVPFVHFGNCPDRVPQATPRQAYLSDAAQNYLLRGVILSSRSAISPRLISTPHLHTSPQRKALSWVREQRCRCPLPFRTGHARFPCIRLWAL
jgi:hypothetical protein